MYLKTYRHICISGEARQRGWQPSSEASQWCPSLSPIGRILAEEDYANEIAEATIPTTRAGPPEVWNLRDLGPKCLEADHWQLSGRLDHDPLVQLVEALDVAVHRPVEDCRPSKITRGKACEKWWTRELADDRDKNLRLWGVINVRKNRPPDLLNHIQESRWHSRDVEDCKKKIFTQHNLEDVKSWARKRRLRRQWTPANYAINFEILGFFQ